jgi:hypothetical protein
MLYDWQTIDVSKIIRVTYILTYICETGARFYLVLEVASTKYTAQTIEIRPKSKQEAEALLAFYDRISHERTLLEHINHIDSQIKTLSERKDNFRSEMKIILQSFFPKHKVTLYGDFEGKDSGTVSSIASNTLGELDDYFVVYANIHKQSEQDILKKFYSETKKFARKYYKERNLLPIDLGHAILK